MKAVGLPTIGERIEILKACTEAIKAVPTEDLSWADYVVEPSVEQKCREALIKCMAHAAVGLSAACAVIYIAKDEIQNPS